MVEGKEARKVLDELAKIIYDSKPMIRGDHIVGWYRTLTRLHALEKALIKKGILKQEDVDAEQIPLLEECKKDF